MVGVIGAGKFGLTISQLLAKNTEVLLYVRNKQVYQKLCSDRTHKGVTLSENISFTNDKKDVPEKCNVIFPVVPSANFRQMVRDIATYLTPKHIVIHCTKGLDIGDVDFDGINIDNIKKDDIRTLSSVILEESPVVRVGCLSGPNLAKEILEGLPTATVIASEYNEVIAIGQKYLSSKLFYVFGSNDLLGAELAGAYKNVVALASGIIGGKNLGKNLQGMLITRGLREMSILGQILGSSNEAFIGTAGIGDLVATATSENSRNYSLGFRLGKGESMQEILADMDEVAEGVRTLKIAHFLSLKYKAQAHITQTLYKVVYADEDIDRAIERLMRFPFAPDVDFM